MEKLVRKQRPPKNIINQGSRVLKIFSCTECNDISFPTFLPGTSGQQDDIVLQAFLLHFCTEYLVMCIKIDTEEIVFHHSVSLFSIHIYFKTSRGEELSSINN